VPSTRRYLQAYLRPGSIAVDRLEMHYDRGGERLPASLYRPAGTTRRLPGWVVLHGLTTSGREHVSLIRFATALAASGAIVFVPELPEWRQLRVEPHTTVPTIRAAVHALHDDARVDPDRVGLFGFSFGATQGLVAAADPAVDALLRGIVAWGGYRDLGRLFRFGLTGEHELDAVRHQLRPDPYGCWIVAGNYLTLAPGHEDAHDVARAAMRLALESGKRQVYAGDPMYDPYKRELRQTIAPERRALFDRIAPPSSAPLRSDPATLDLADALVAAASRAEPLLDPTPALPRITTPIVIAHGRDDRLIPFTESLRMARSLPADVLSSVTVTGLFSHSGGAEKGLGPLAMATETVRFVRMLNRALHAL
jgi:pimeloyl-ACP methyl ester carboxylesterase